MWYITICLGIILLCVIAILLEIFDYTDEEGTNEKDNSFKKW